MKLNAKQLRDGKSTVYRLQTTEKNEIYIIQDNILDTYNIGSIFRLADAVNAKKVFLCGGTETPPNPRIKKASINTTEIVEWTYYENAKEVINDLRLKINDLKVIAIEQNEKSIPYNKFEYKLPICLVVGNESYGILAETLKECDGIVELPMFGVNISLNVMVSLAIILYRVMEVSERNNSI